MGQPQDSSNVIMEQEDPPKSVDKMSWTVAVVMVILTLFIAIFCTVMFSSNPTPPFEYEQVLQNWAIEPIMNIFPSSVGCREYLTEYTFPGTTQGCDCRASMNSDIPKIITQSDCNSFQLSNGCRVVNSTPQQTFTSWMVNSQIFQLCVDRFLGYNYMSSDCSKAGYKRCGISENDTIGATLFCVPSDVDCPINSIVQGVVQPDYTYWSIFNLGASLRIFVSRQSLINQPLAFSSISTGQSECSDFQNKSFFNQGITPYVLLRNRNSTCTSEQTDSRFDQLFTIPDVDLFSSNKYLNVLSDLPEYPLGRGHSYTLFTRSYIPWNQSGECRSNHMHVFITIREGLNTSRDIMIGCIIINWIVFVFFGLLASALRLKFLWKIRNLFIIPTAAILLCQLVLTCIAFFNAVGHYGRFKDMQDASCSDDPTNRMISSFNSDYFSGRVIPQIVLFSCVIVLMLLTLLFMQTIFLIVCPSPKNKDENDERRKGNGKDGEEMQQLYGKKNGNLFDKDIKHAAGPGGYSNTFNLGEGGENADKQESKRSELASQNLRASRGSLISPADSLGGRNGPPRENLLLPLQKKESQPVKSNIVLQNSRQQEMQPILQPTIEKKRRQDNGRQDDKEVYLVNDEQLNILMHGNEDNENNENKNKKDWEFDIDEYVIKHRENNYVSSRIGGGYEIGRNRQKYLPHKFLQSHQHQQKTTNTIAIEDFSDHPGEKPEQSQNDGRSIKSFAGDQLDFTEEENNEKQQKK